MRKSVTPFVLAQPAKLNHLVDDTMPLSWGVRWRKLKIALPLTIFSSLCLVEMAFVRVWLADKLAD